MVLGNLAAQLLLQFLLQIERAESKTRLNLNLISKFYNVY